MLSSLEDYLDYADIKYKNIEDQFLIPIIGGSILTLKKEQNKIIFYFQEYGGDREIELKINLTEKNEDLLADFIKEFYNFLNKQEGQFFSFKSNDSLYDWFESRLYKLFGKNNYEINITNENPASIDSKIIEKPEPIEDIKWELEQLKIKIENALNNDQKKLYDFYIKRYKELEDRLKSLDENTSFKFLKKFKDFFD